MSMEVITMHDKDVRDRLFQDLRKNGNELERQVVKFSSNEPVMGEAEIQEGRFVFYDKRRRRPQWRPLYRSTWSVGYPTS
jgi:hypothetical protein